MSADAAEPPRPSEHPAPDLPLVAPALEDLLVALRSLAAPCEPPVGIGAFDVLYASVREVVVWYSPARHEHVAGEVVILTMWIAAAWEALVSGEALDEPALVAMCEGRAGSGRWLLALLAQAPGVTVRELPDDSLALVWSASAWRAWQHKRIASRKSDTEQAPIRARRSRSRRTSAE